MTGRMIVCKIADSLNRVESLYQGLRLNPDESHYRASAWVAFRDIVFRSLTLPFLVRRTEEYGLSDRQPTDASDRAVDSRVVLGRTNDRLQHFWRRTCRIRIKVHHRAANVVHSDGDGGGVVPLAEGHHTAQPLVLLEGNRSQ